MSSRFASIACLALVCALAAAAAVAQSVNPGDGKRATDALQAGDFATALSIMKPLADAGDPYAIFVLGQMAEQGAGMPRNLREAARHYERAAALGRVHDGRVEDRVLGQECVEGGEIALAHDPVPGLERPRAHDSRSQ